MEVGESELISSSTVMIAGKVHPAAGTAEMGRQGSGLRP